MASVRIGGEMAWFRHLARALLRLYFLRNRRCGCVMQTLNVGAGRTDEEYKATGEQRRADLRFDCRDDANYFFWAAGLSALGTGLLPVRLNLLVSVGTVDLLTLYGRPLGPFYPLAGCGKSLNRDDSPPQGLKPSLILHDLRGAKAPHHSAAGFRDFFRSLLEKHAAPVQHPPETAVENQF